MRKRKVSFYAKYPKVGAAAEEWPAKTNFVGLSILAVPWHQSQL